jgi:hypothetical protein
MSNPTLEDLSALSKEHETVGQALFNACNAEVFPCDALVFAALDRSLGLIRGFKLLMENGGYSSAVALVRMQLDSSLRLYGVISSGDAHLFAERVMHGVPLRDLKDKAGKKLTDRRLVDEFKKLAPWVDDLYNHCSGYIHLSSSHIAYFLGRSEPTPDGQQTFAIGDEDEHVPEVGKQRMNQAFTATTKALLKLAKAWIEVRETHGPNEQLKSIYARSA